MVNQCSFTIDEDPLGIISASAGLVLRRHEDIQLIAVDLRVKGVSVGFIGNRDEGPMLSLRLGASHNSAALYFDMPGWEIITAAVDRYTLFLCFIRGSLCVG